MDLTGLYPFLAVFCAIAGMFVGSWVKRRSYLIIPFNDPISWTLLLGFMLVLLMPDIDPDLVFIDVYDPGHLACILGFISMYVYGYVKEELLMEFVSVHDIFKLRQTIEPLAYYWKDDQLCWQPQKMIWVLKRMLLNVDCPLDFPMEAINRRRYIEFQGKFLRLSAYCVDTAVMHKEIQYVQRWRFKFKVIAMSFDPSPLNTAGPYDYYVEGKIADDYIRNYEKLRINDMNANADIRMARVNGACHIVKNALEMTPESQVFREILNDLDARNTTEDSVDRFDRNSVDNQPGAVRRAVRRGDDQGGGHDE